MIEKATALAYIGTEALLASQSVHKKGVLSTFEKACNQWVMNWNDGVGLPVDAPRGFSCDLYP